MAKIIEPIEPFNEIYYQSCLYNSLFPVIRHFQLSILPLLINDWLVYETARTGKALFAESLTEAIRVLLKLLQGLESQSRRNGLPEQSLTKSRVR